MTHCIYYYHDNTNGMTYIGQAKGSFLKRHKDHLTKARSDNASQYIDQAINKHGFEYFDFGLLEVVETQKETDEAEAFWIWFLGTLAPNGYNIKSGGSNASGWKQFEWRDRKRSKLVDELEQQIIDMYLHGSTTYEVGAIFGYTARGVGLILIRNGVVPRKPKESLTKFTKEQQKQILISYKAGSSSIKIAAKFGCSDTTIRRYIKSAGGKMRSAGEALLGIGKGRKQSEETKRKTSIAKRRYNDEQERQIVAMYQSGLSAAKVGDVFGCRQGVVRNILARNGVQARTNAMFTKEQEQQIIAMYLSGSSSIKVAVAFQCGDNAVLQILKRNGYKARTISKALKGRPAPNKGKKASASTREKNAKNAENRNRRRNGRFA